jgi:hypothetical protein
MLAALQLFLAETQGGQQLIPLHHVHVVHQCVLYSFKTRKDSIFCLPDQIIRVEYGPLAPDVSIFTFFCFNFRFGRCGLPAS